MLEWCLLFLLLVLLFLLLLVLLLSFIIAIYYCYLSLLSLWYIMTIAIMLLPLSLFLHIIAIIINYYYYYHYKLLLYNMYFFVLTPAVGSSRQNHMIDMLRKIIKWGPAPAGAWILLDIAGIEWESPRPFRCLSNTDGHRTQAMPCQANKAQSHGGASG